VSPSSSSYTTLLLSSPNGGTRKTRPRLVLLTTLRITRNSRFIALWTRENWFLLASSLKLLAHTNACQHVKRSCTTTV
jgi:hypothetical protein